jgi:DNA-directed RNA polymerase specialized sigma24 family protein
LNWRENALVGFRQGVEATVPALRRYARALTRNAELADDLVQDTLVRALRSEHLFHGGDIRSWLYTILTNLNRNRLRSLARRPPMQAIEDNDAPDMTGPRQARVTSSGRSPRSPRINARRSFWSCWKALPIGRSPKCRGCRSGP